MARIRNYIQDEDKPFGVGTFVLDDGSEYYLDDADRAREFHESVERESTNIAERGSVDRKGGELDGAQKYENAVAKLAGVPEPNAPFRGIDTGPSAMRRAVAGPGGGEELATRQGELSGELDRASGVTPPEKEKQDEPAPADAPPPSPSELRNQEASRRIAQAVAATPTRTAGTDPRALGPGVRVDQNYSRKGGMTADEYNRQAAARAGAHEAQNEMIARHYQEDAAIADAEIERLRGEALAQKKANDVQALELQRKQTKYAEDRQWLEKDVDAFYDKSKPDPDRLFKQRGVFGNIAVAIAQFMGAYASVVSGTPNFANQILSKKLDADIDAQIEEFKRGKMKRDGQLARMADRGMSLEQMRSALRLQQEMVLQKEIKAAALREGTREAKQAAEALIMDGQKRFITEENKFRTEALGEETVSGQMVRPTGGRALTPLEYQQQINAYLEATTKGEHLAQGGDYAVAAEERAKKERWRQEDRTDKKAAEDKLTEPQAKAEAAHRAVTDLGTKAGLVRDKSGKWVVGGGAVPPALLQRFGETVTGGIYQGDIGPAFDAAVEAFGRQQSGGVIGKEERPTFETQLGKQTTSRQQLADRLNAAENNIEAKRKKELADIRGGSTNAAPSYWQNENDEDRK